MNISQNLSKRSTRSLELLNGKLFDAGARAAVVGNRDPMESHRIARKVVVAELAKRKKAP